MRPSFIVIGAQKAGSTYLLQCLRDHPAIFMPRSEIPFFEDPLYGEAGLPAFERHFDNARSDQVVGMKRPNLLGLPEAPGNIADLVPNAKLIAILRNPFERAVSGYFHYMMSGFLPIQPIEIGLPRILAGDYDHLPRAREVIEFGKYADHLDNYDQHFSRQQMLIQLLDDVRTDPQTAISACYEFLAVDPAYTPTPQNERPMAAAYSLTRLRLRTALIRLSNPKAGSEKYPKPTTGPLAKLNTALDRFVWAKLFKAKAPKLWQVLFDRLAAIYEPQIDRLETRLGRSLEAWRVPRR